MEAQGWDVLGAGSPGSSVKLNCNREWLGVVGDLYRL